MLPPTEAPVAGPLPTLLELVQATPELSTLLTAIETADANRNIPPSLVAALSGPDDLTVFAPINSGFEAVDAVVPGYVAMLLTPEFGLHLFSILSYHVTPGIVTTSSFPILDLPMLEEGSVAVEGAPDTGFEVISFSPVPATILEPLDIPASNGVAHLVDNVLVPRFVTQNLITGLMFRSETQNGEFSALLRLIVAAGLDTTLAEIEGVALLAPPNDAIPAATEEFLLTPGNEDILTAVVSYHVINELFNYAAQEIPNILLVQSLQGERIVAGLVESGDSVAVSYNQGVQQDFFPVQQNLIYVIDRILVPATLSTVVPRSIDGVPEVFLELASASDGESTEGGDPDVEPASVAENDPNAGPVPTLPPQIPANTAGWLDSVSMRAVDPPSTSP